MYANFQVSYLKIISVIVYTRMKLHPKIAHLSLRHLSWNVRYFVSDSSLGVHRLAWVCFRRLHPSNRPLERCHHAVRLDALETSLLAVPWTVLMCVTCYWYLTARFSISALGSCVASLQKNHHQVDLTARGCDIFLWGFLKSKVCENKPMDSMLLSDTKWRKSHKRWRAE